MNPMKDNNTESGVFTAIRRYMERHGLRTWKPRAALIDMDGTLIDSMRNHTAAWQRLAMEQGLHTRREEFYLYEGMTGRATLRLIFKRDKGIDISDAQADELYRLKTRYFNELPRVPVIPGASRMLRELQERGVARVLVTGSRQLSNLNRLDDDFPGAFSPQLRITAADVTHGKPHPEPYLKGMQLAGVLPQESIVVENAPLGVQAGAAAGAFTLAVATGPIPRRELLAAGADMVFDSMEQLADALSLCLSKCCCYE